MRRYIIYMSMERICEDERRSKMKNPMRRLLVLVMSLAMVTVPVNWSFAAVTESGADYYVEFNMDTGFIEYAQAGGSKILDIPESIQGEPVIGIRKGAVHQEENIEKLKLSKSMHTIEDGTFANCYKLYSVEADSNNTDFTVHNGALMNAEKTRLILYPAEKNDLTKFTILSSVTEMDPGAFAFNKTLKKIDVPGSVKVIKAMTFREFGGEVTLNEGTEVIGKEAFMAYDTSGLTDFTIPDSVTTIEEDAFYGNVTGNLHIGKGITELNKDSNMRGIKAAGFTVSEDNPVYSSKDGFVLTKDGKGLVLVPAGLTTINVPEGVETIKKGALSETEAETINLPSTLKTVEDGALKGNRSLLNVNVTEDNTSLLSEGGMLLTADKKTLLYIPEGRSGALVVPDGVETVAKGAFNNIEGVNSLTIPDSVKTIKAEAVLKDGNLELSIGKGVKLIEPGAIKVTNYSSRINVSPENMSYKTDEEGGILLTKDGTRLVLLTNVGAGTYKEMIDYSPCLVIPEGITTIGSYGIYNISSFRTIVLGSGVKTVEPYAVYNCHEIGSIKAEGIENIKDFAFAGLRNLSTAYIGNGLKSIGKGSFGGSESDVEITYDGSRSEWNKIPGSSIDNISYADPAPETAVTVKFTSNAAQVTVIGGTGSGSYKEGETVRIKADKPAEFTGWKAEGVILEDASAAETTFVMPADDVNITADYREPEYTVAVENGTGGGTYHKGDRVTVKAAVPAYEKFVSWTATGINVPENAGAEFTFVMPAGNVKLTANSKHFHDFNGIWQMDEKEHWKECSCGEKGEAGAHSFGKRADAPEAGNLEARTCSLCGYRETREKKPVEIPAKPDEKGNVIITAPDAETVQFSGSDFINITENEEVKEMTVLMGQQSVKYDKAALKAVSENTAAGDIIEIRLTETDNKDSALNITQKDKIKGMGNGTLYSIELVIRDVSGKEKSVHDFNGGIAVVTVPYANTAGGMVLVYRVETDGTLTPMPTTYDSKAGEVSWITGGHSHYIITSAKAPVITKGAKAEWKSGTKTGLTLTSDAEFADFLSVKVDNRVVDAKNYDVKEGSTIVTLKSSYLETLTAGKHTLTISSRSGDAETSFTLIAKVNDNTKEDTAGNGADSTVPKTGDSNNMVIWFVLLGVVLAVLAVLVKKHGSK